MSKTNRNLMKLIVSSIMIALSVILTRFLPDITPTIRLNMGYVPIFFIAVLFSPAYGGAVGASADFIGFLVNPKGPSYFPGFTLSYLLMGVITGLAANIFKKKNGGEISMLCVFVSVLISTVFVTALNSYWLHLMYGMPYFVLLLSKALPALALYIAHSLITYLLIKITRKAKLI